MKIVSKTYGITIIDRFNVSASKLPLPNDDSRKDFFTEIRLTLLDGGNHHVATQEEGNWLRQPLIPFTEMM